MSNEPQDLDDIKHTLALDKTVRIVLGNDHYTAYDKQGDLAGGPNSNPRTLLALLLEDLGCDIEFA